MISRAIAKKLFDNMSDRRGFHTDDLDDDVKETWLQEWTEIVESELAKQPQNRKKP